MTGVFAGFRGVWTTRNITRKAGPSAPLNHPTDSDLSAGTPLKSAPLRMTNLWGAEREQRQERCCGSAARGTLGALGGEFLWGGDGGQVAACEHGLEEAYQFVVDQAVGG